MLDVTLLAKDITTLLVPAIPFLLKGGEKAFEEASKKIGGDTWGLAKSTWEKLTSLSKSNDEVEKAAEEIVNDPSDKDAQAALRFQIKKLLNDAPEELRQEIYNILNKTENTSGQTSITIGGVHISGESRVANSGNIVGGNQTTGK
jgi:hypothetical protein